MSGPDNIPELAGRLTEAQKRAVVYGKWPDPVCETREMPVKSALLKKGIADFRHVIAGRGDYTLTPLGQQVRAYLQGDKQ